MARDTSTQSGGIGLGTLILVLFIALKLTGVISWSWWWVLAPLWAPLVVIAIIFVVVGLLASYKG